MPTKTLISQDAQKRVYEVRDDTGQLLHTAVEAILLPEDQNRVTLTERAAQALNANATFLGVASPTNAQVVAQVQRLTRECSALIRLLVGALDDISGT